MAEYTYLRRRSDVWTLVEDFPPSAAEWDWSSEGMYMQEVLKHDIPLLLNGQLFSPLCLEFPGSPGLDLLYIGDKGDIALVESKVEGKVTPEAWAAELCYRHTQLNDKTMMDLLLYLQSHPRACKAATAGTLMSWIITHGRKSEDTLGQLSSEGHVVVGALSFGACSLPTLPMAHLPWFSCCVRAFDNTTALILQTRSGPVFTLGHLPDMWEELKSGRKRHEVALDRLRQQSGKRERSKLDPTGYFDAMPDNAATKMMFGLLKDKGFEYAASTSRTDREKKITLQYPKIPKKCTSVVSLFYEDQVNLHWDVMERDAEAFGTTPEAVRAALNGIRAILPRGIGALHMTAGNYMEIHCEQMATDQKRTILQKTVEILMTLLSI